MRRQSTLCMFAPGCDGALGLGRFTPDKSNKDVETSNGEEEEGRDEGKCVDMMGEDGSTDANGKGKNE